MRSKQPKRGPQPRFNRLRPLASMLCAKAAAVFPTLYPVCSTISSSHLFPLSNAFFPLSIFKHQPLSVLSIILTHNKAVAPGKTQHLAFYRAVKRVLNLAHAALAPLCSRISLAGLGASTRAARAHPVSVPKRECPTWRTNRRCQRSNILGTDPLLRRDLPQNRMSRRSYKKTPKCRKGRADGNR